MLAAAVLCVGAVTGCGSSKHGSHTANSGGGSASAPGVTAHQIIIGSPQPLSGPFKYYGEFANAGIQGVFNKINAEGGIYGRKLKLVTTDTQCTSGAAAVSAARELLDQDHAFMLGVTQCPVADTAIDQSVLKGTDIADVTSDGAGWVVPGRAPNPAKGDAYAYFITPNTADQAVDAIAWAQTHLSPTPHKWGLIEDDDLYGTNCGYAIQQFAKVHGLPAPVEVQTSDTQTSQTVNIAKIRSAGADTLALCTDPGPTSGALSAALSAGWHPNIMLATLASAQAAVVLPTLPKAAYAKAWGVKDPLVPALGSPAMTAYVNSYKRYYPSFNANSVTEGAPSAELIVAYLKRAGKNLTRQSFLKALYSGPVQVPGPTFPVKIQPGPHTEAVGAESIVTFPNASREHVVGLQYPPSNVKLPGVG
jgi:branched-chain amino acid transport system substrate-binding protein